VDIKFPLFAFEKDDDSMFLIETPDRILHHFEWIDIENEEFIFWDSTASGLCVTVKDRQIEAIRPCSQTMTISDAFQAYSHSLGLEISLDGSPAEVWARIQAQLPQKRRLWTKLFSK
jgi:hypothetical protein